MLADIASPSYDVIQFKSDAASDSYRPDPSALSNALGAEILIQRAGAGDREAQWSLGYQLVNAADVAVGGASLGATGRSPQADVGFALCPDSFPVSHHTSTRRCGHLMTKSLVCGRRPREKEGTAFLEQATGQGHAHAMCAMGTIHHARNEHEQAVEWFTKGAEAGLPRAMYHVGYYLDMGEGVAAPDSPAAAEWHRRAAEAGFGEAASALCHMYTLGRGRAWHIMPATLSSTLQTLASRARWQLVTLPRALSARPWCAASRGASGGRCNGGSKPPRTVTPNCAVYSPPACT